MPTGGIDEKFKGFVSFSFFIFSIAILGMLCSIFYGDSSPVSQDSSSWFSWRDLLLLYFGSIRVVSVALDK